MEINTQNNNSSFATQANLESKPLSDSSKVEKANYWKIGFFISLLCLIGFIAFVYFYSGNNIFINQKEKKPEKVVSILPPSPTVVESSPSPREGEITWRRTNFMGSYSFEYPNGWHVSNQWSAISPEQSESQRHTMLIIIDPEPINTAPRGGPISAIMMSDKSGLQNPDEVFDNDRELFKNSLQDLEENIIQADFGTIYHYKGKINVYNQMVETERYYFMIQGGIQDNINKHIIMASLETDISNSEILRKIVTSFKRE